MKSLTYEYVVPSQIFMADPEDWPPLVAARGGLTMSIRKPVVGTKLAGVDNTLGNEGVLVKYTLMRVDLEIPDEDKLPEWYVPFSLVRECLAWIRVAGRQYWLGFVGGETESVARGSIITWAGQNFTYTNFGAAKMPIFAPPLSKALWQSIGAELTACRDPTVTETLYCDALLRFREGDFRQTVVGPGIVCELELNAFTDDLLPHQPEAVRKLYAARGLTFSWKLNNMPGILSGESYRGHNPTFASELHKLYELRGSAVHSASLGSGANGDPKPLPDFKTTSTFMFAVEDFLRWTKERRRRLGNATGHLVSAPIKYTIGPAGA